MSTDSFSDPPEQHSPANIMNALYNDCLMELFDRVDTLDLYVLAYVCKRFREIAVKILKVRLKDTSFRRVDLIIYRRSVPKALRADCIRVFGPTGAFIFAGLDDNVVLRTIARHCTDFGKLDLMFLGIDAQTVTSLRPCFPELRKLTIPATNIFDGCATDVDWQLEKLSMHVVNENPIMPSIKTPRLKKFNFFGRKFNVSLSGARIFEYLASNDVSTVCFDFCNFNWAQWCRLPECAPNLQKLRLFDNSFAEDTDTDGATNNQMPDRFRFLSVCLLHRCSNTERFMELLRGAPLQRLKIYGYKESSLIASICKLNTISILAIRGLARSIKLLDEDLERLERSLPNLREIAVKGYFSFKCIERILGRAANIKKFDIGLRFIGTSYRLELDAMNSISSIVAGRPDLALKIRIRRRYLRVSDKLIDFRCEQMFSRKLLIVSLD